MDLFREFCDEFTREMNRVRMERDAGAASAQRELAKVEREIQKLIQAHQGRRSGTHHQERADGPGSAQDRPEHRLAELETPPPAPSEHVRSLSREGHGPLSRARGR